MSLAGIQDAVTLGELTKFVQFVSPGENEEKSSPDIIMAEIFDTVGNRRLNEATTCVEENKYDDNSRMADESTPAEKAEKIPDSLAPKTILLVFNATARMLRSSAWLAEGLVTFDI